MTDTILEMRDITKTFPGVKALSNVNLSVEEGEIHAVVGENGAGKSTLMKVLSGVYPSGTYDGNIIFRGQDCHFKGIHDSEKQGIVISRTRFGGEDLVHRGLQSLRPWDVGTHVIQPPRRPRHLRHEDFLRRGARERSFAGQHAEGDQA